MKRIVRWPAVTVLAWFPIAARAATFYSIEDPTLSTYASAVSDDGSTVVGYLRDGGRNPRGAFRWRVDTGIQMLGPAESGSANTGATDVSEDGSVVVGFTEQVDGVDAFVWNAIGGLRTLTASAGVRDTIATAISADGSTIVGRQFEPLSSFPDGLVWDRSGRLNVLHDPRGEFLGTFATDVSSDGSIVVGGASVGTIFPSDSRRMFLWDAVAGFRELGGLPGEPVGGQANAISYDGTIVVGSSLIRETPPSSRPTRDVPFIFSAAGGMSALPWDFQNFGRAEDVSRDGSVVVGTYGIPGPFSFNLAMIWDREHGLRTVDTMLRSVGIELAGWRLEQATGVSGDGTVLAGVGINPNGKQVAWVAVIPEPTTAVLLAVGLGVLGRYSRRTR